MDLHEANAHRHTVTVPSGQLSYLDVGKGPPAVFVHGVGTNAFLWRHVLDRLAGGRRCIAPDLPLHGRSPARPDQDLSLDGLARVLLEFGDALDLRRIDRSSGCSPRSPRPTSSPSPPVSPG